MRNMIIRNFCYESGIYLYKFAELVGLSENCFTKHMRNEFPESVQHCLVECMKKKLKGEDYDLRIWNEFREHQAILSQAKRNDNYRKRSTDLARWRKLNYALDEAEKRRIEGGWDSWQ